VPPLDKGLVINQILVKKSRQKYRATIENLVRTAQFQADVSANAPRINLDKITGTGHPVLTIEMALLFEGRIINGHFNSPSRAECFSTLSKQIQSGYYQSVPMQL
jgi:hypothetical protein